MQLLYFVKLIFVSMFQPSFLVPRQAVASLVEKSFASFLATRAEIEPGDPLSTARAEALPETDVAQLEAGQRRSHVNLPLRC